MKKKKGQAAVEIALMLPIVLLLLCIIIDIFRVLYVINTLNMVSQEAARYASFNHSNTDIEIFAKNNCPFKEKDSRMTVTTTPDDEPRKSGTNVTVRVKYDIKYITPLIGWLTVGNSSINVGASSTIRVE